jgi:hypothetical protein
VILVQKLYPFHAAAALTGQTIRPGAGGAGVGVEIELRLAGVKPRPVALAERDLAARVHAAGRAIVPQIVGFDLLSVALDLRITFQFGNIGTEGLYGVGPQESRSRRSRANRA